MNVYIFLQFFGERNYVTFALWHEPSICRLSSVTVTLLRYPEGWTFRQYFYASCNRLGTWQFVLEFWKTNSHGLWVIMQVRRKGYKTLIGVVRPISCFISKTIQDTTIQWRRRGNRISALSNGAIFNDLDRPSNPHKGRASIRRRICR